MFHMSFEVRSFYSSVRLTVGVGGGGCQASGTKPIPHNLSLKNIRLLSGGEVAEIKSGSYAEFEVNKDGSRRSS